MKAKYFGVCVICIALLFVSCSSKNERMIKGKWSLKSKMIGGAPSSYWFKSGGTVEAPWENRMYADKSEGAYEFIDDKHIRIIMSGGFYKGSVYYFDIVKLSENEMILRNNYQDVKFKKVE